MSKGPGAVERRIADLFAATRDRALSVSDITDHAFELGGRLPTRVQRLSATRAAHRLLRRAREADTERIRLIRRAHQNIEAALGRGRLDPDDEFDALLHKDPLYLRAKGL